MTKLHNTGGGIPSTTTPVSQTVSNQGAPGASSESLSSESRELQKAVKKQAKRALDPSNMLAAAAFAISAAMTPAASYAQTPSAQAHVSQIRASSEAGAPKKKPAVKRWTSQRAPANTSQKTTPQKAPSQTAQSVTVASIASLAHADAAPVRIGSAARKQTQEQAEQAERELRIERERQRMDSLFRELNQPDQTYAHFLAKIESLREINALENLGGTGISSAFMLKLTALYFEPKYYPATPNQAVQHFESFAKNSLAAARQIYTDYFKGRSTPEVQKMESILQRLSPAPVAQAPVAPATTVVTLEKPPVVQKTAPAPVAQTPVVVQPPVVVQQKPAEERLAKTEAKQMKQIPLEFAAAASVNTSPNQILKQLPQKAYFGADITEEARQFQDKHILIQQSAQGAVPNETTRVFRMAMALMSGSGNGKLSDEAALRLAISETQKATAAQSDEVLKKMVVALLVAGGESANQKALHLNELIPDGLQINQLAVIANALHGHENTTMATSGGKPGRYKIAIEALKAFSESK
jgi:hypothetical protein